MKKLNREINVFSMSALDLFASALGAFILIVVVLMPYYLKSGTVLQCPTPEPTPLCPICPTPTPTPTCPEPTREVTDNLLVIEMEWSARADVDMHVHTPNGEFFFGRTSISGKPGKFTLDNTEGGPNSLEIWKAYNPSPGNYRVCFKLFNKRGASGSVRVRGGLDKPTGPIVIPPINLIRSGEERCVLRFHLDSEYSFTRR